MATAVYTNGQDYIEVDVTADPGTGRSVAKVVFAPQGWLNTRATASASGELLVEYDQSLSSGGLLMTYGRFVKLVGSTITATTYTNGKQWFTDDLGRVLELELQNGNVTRTDINAAVLLRVFWGNRGTATMDWGKFSDTQYVNGELRLYWSGRLFATLLPVRTGLQKSAASKDCCPKCGHAGEFIRMALCCPQHGVFGGC